VLWLVAQGPRRWEAGTVPRSPPPPGAVLARLLQQPLSSRDAGSCSGSKACAGRVDCSLPAIGQTCLFRVQLEAGPPMIRIAISVEAFEAIARTLPLGSVGVEPKANEQDKRLDLA
jgi:hypothetical protein